MQRSVPYLPALALGSALLLLAACGDSTGDRAMSGGAIGAGVGAAAGAVTGTSVLGGAVIGGAAGAATGAATDEDQIDLGKPVWRD
jgi:osmotically inducible lipoprotein OsmB